MTQPIAQMPASEKLVGSDISEVFRLGNLSPVSFLGGASSADIDAKVVEQEETEETEK